MNIPAGYPADLNGAFAVLKTRKKLAPDDLKALAMLESAGEVFYLSIAKATANDEARKLLTRNGQEERGHAHRIVKAIKLLTGEDFELPAHRDNPFAQGIPEQMQADAALLGGLELGEQDGDLQYQTWAATEPNAEVAKLYRQNGVEETLHGERVAQVKRLLSVASQSPPPADARARNL